MAIPCGPAESGTVATTLDAAVSITSMPVSVVTYAREPSGLNTTRRGPVPTLISAVTLLVAMSITATTLEPPGPLSLPVTAAYALLPSGETATSCGLGPTFMGVAALVDALTAITAYCPVSAT